MPEISIVIPVKDEEKSIAPLYLQIKKVLNKIKRSFEIVIVDDGSTDKTYEVAKKLHRKDKRVKVIRLRGNWGKSIALQAGFESSNGKVIFTMDGDLQDDPVEIPRFLKKLNEGFDLVSGWKKKRHDPPSKVIPSRILNNMLIPALTGVKIHDTNCGFKAYKREVIQDMRLYGELYRYIPIIASKRNFLVTEIEIHHKSRKYGKSKFGWSRNLKGFLDLITIFFLTGYLKRPAHFFGTLGILSFSPGFLIGIYITYLWFTTGSIQFHQPLLMLGLLLMVVGVQLITTGLIAEMMTNFNTKRHSSESVIREKLS